MIIYVKDPDAIKDYGWDWSDFLASDTITDSSWATSDTEADLIIESDTFTDTITTVILSGGMDGQIYTVTNHVVTAAGLEDDRSFRLRIAQQ